MASHESDPSGIDPGRLTRFPGSVGTHRPPAAAMDGDDNRAAATGASPRPLDGRAGIDDMPPPSAVRPGPADAPSAGPAPSDPAADWADPPRIGGYAVTGRLGRGGMGVVWQATQLSTRRPVALKLLGAGVFASPSARRWFEREVELLARLDHPHVARVYDSGVDRGVYFYAMELVDGGVPLDRYARERNLGRGAVLRLVAVVCEAVQHAHQNRVIHRDLKPGNILVTPDGRPKVVDFGLAKALLDGDPADGDRLLETRSGEVAGTPAFMSPEQAAGRPVDTRTDVYALGVILYRLLTGRAPHDLSGTYLDVLRRVSEHDVARPRAADPRLDRDLEAVLLKALAKDPDQRYATAGELARDLGRHLAGEPVLARRWTARYLVGRQLRRHRAAVAAAVLAAAGLTVVVLQMERRVRRERDAANASAADAAGQAAPRQREDVVRKTLAERDEMLAERIRMLAERNGMLAQSLMAEAENAWAAGRFREAADRYADAAPVLTGLGLTDLPAEIGLTNLLRRRPPPLLELTAAAAEPLVLPPMLPSAGGAAAGGVQWAEAATAPPAGPPVPLRRLSVPLDGAVERSPVGQIHQRGVAVHDLSLRREEGSPRYHLAFAGRDEASRPSYSRYQLLQTRVDVRPGTVLRYRFRPDNDLGRRVTVDLGFDEGPNLANAEPFGPGRPHAPADPKGVVGEWTTVECPVGRHLAGKLVTAVHVTYDDASGAVGEFCASIADIELVAPDPPPVPPVLDAGAGYGDAVVGEPDGLVSRRDLADGGRRVLGTHAGPVLAVQIGAGGRAAWSVGADGVIRQYAFGGVVGGGGPGPTVGGPADRALVTAGQPFTAAAIARDGSIAACACADGRVRAWDLRTGQPAWASEPHPGGFASADVSADGRWVAAATRDGAVRTWRAADGSPGPTWRIDGIASRLALSPDGGRAVVVGPAGDASLWDVRTGARVWHVPAPAAGTPPADAAAAVAPFWAHAETVLVAGPASGIRVLDARDGRVLRVISAGDAGRPAAAGPSADGRFVIAVGASGPARLWEAASGRPAWLFHGHRGPVTGVAFSPDGAVLASAGADGTVKLWDPYTGRGLRTFTGHGAAVRGVRFSPDGQSLLSHGADGTLVLWSPRGERRRISPGQGELHAATFSGDGGRIITVGLFGWAEIWRADSGARDYAQYGFHPPAFAAAPLPGSTWAVVGWRDGGVRLHDLQTAGDCHRLGGHGNEVHAVAAAPDGRRVASGGLDEVIKVWDVDGRREVASFGERLGKVTGLAYGPGGRHLLASYADGPVRAWDPESGRMLREFEGHPAGTRAVAVSPDGRLVATAGADGTVRLWGRAGNRGGADRPAVRRAAGDLGRQGVGRVPGRDDRGRAGGGLDVLGVGHRGRPPPRVVRAAGGPAVRHARHARHAAAPVPARRPDLVRGRSG